MRSFVATLVTAVALAGGAPASHAQAPSGGVQVQSCDYYARKAQEAESCRIQNQKNGMSLDGGKHANTVAHGSKEKPKTMAGSYYAAAQACANARDQYKAKYEACKSGHGGGGGRNVGNNAGGGNSAAEQVAQMQQLLNQLGELQAAQTKKAIAGVRGATQGLGAGYSGAGISGDIPGLPDDEWSDDSLADLGDAYPGARGAGGHGRDGANRHFGNDPIDGSHLPSVIDFDGPNETAAAAEPTEAEAVPDLGELPDEGGVPDDSYLDESLPGEDAVPTSQPPAAEPSATDPWPDLTETGGTTEADRVRMAEQDAIEELALAESPPREVGGVPADAAIAPSIASYEPPGADGDAADEVFGKFSTGGLESDMQRSEAEQYRDKATAGRAPTESSRRDIEHIAGFGEGAMACGLRNECSKLVPGLSAHDVLMSSPDELAGRLGTAFMQKGHEFVNYGRERLNNSKLFHVFGWKL